MLDDLVRNGAGRDLARVADDQRNPERAFPVGFFSLRNGVMPPSGQELRCGPLSVEYMTKVFSAMPSSSR